MFGECHAHIFMDGVNYRQAAKMYEAQLNEADIRRKLAYYQQKGISYVRDGGDHYGASVFASQIAGEYGITYRTPIFAIHKNGHYGKIVGRGFSDWKEYLALVREVKACKGHFVKIMISGIMDFGNEGTLTEEPLTKEEIQEMIHIAHEEGMAVMTHANGAEAVRFASESKVDSVEHGNFLDEEALLAMRENGTVWVPTYVTITNLIGSGRFDDEALKRLKERQGQMIRRGFELGVQIALGSDAGAFCVLHGDGLYDEYRELTNLFGNVENVDQRFQAAEEIIRNKF